MLIHALRRSLQCSNKYLTIPQKNDVLLPIQDTKAKQIGGEEQWMSIIANLPRSSELPGRLVNCMFLMEILGKPVYGLEGVGAASSLRGDERRTL